MQHSEQSAFTQGIAEAMCVMLQLPSSRKDRVIHCQSRILLILLRRLHDTEVCACSKCLLSEAEAIHEDDVACRTLVVAQLILMCTVRVRCRALVSHCVVLVQFASSEGVACFHS